MSSELKDAVLTKVQECLSLNPVIVLGTGYSMPLGVPGMGPLAQKLAALQPNEGRDQWCELCNLLETHDLETALQKVRLDDELEALVVRTTWELVHHADLKVLGEVRSGQMRLYLSELVKHLLNSRNPQIEIVTTNYDRLAEYAVEAAGYQVDVGFRHGYLRSWSGEPRCLYERDIAGYKQMRSARVYKVHGSLDWFMKSDEPECWPDVRELPELARPLIVTPGLAKYAHTHEEPFRTVMSSMDSAVKRARAVFAIGFGFNDSHVQAKLRRRCHTDKLMIVVATKTLTDGAQDFLLRGRCADFLALEECPSGTRVFSPDNLEGVELPGEQLWRADELVRQAI